MNFDTADAHGGWRPTNTRFLDIIEDPKFQLIVALQNLVTVVSTSHWNSRGVSALHLPITTNSISSPMGLGSDSLPVSIDLFGQRTHLADSMQFMLEYGCRFNPQGAWYLMPSFRGEDADETHLNQFFHSEAEIPGKLGDVMSAVEDYVRVLAEATLVAHGDSLRALGKRTDHLERMAESTRFVSMTLDDAIDFLKDDNEAVEFSDGWRSITRHGEQRLMNEVSEFVWVTHFDHVSVPFYQAFDGPSRSKALNGDLLFGCGETIGAGQRHTDAGSVRESLALHGVPEEPYSWYVKMKEAYPMETSGFGMGVERWMMWVLGETDVRDLQLVPRLNGVTIVP